MVKSLDSSVLLMLPLILPETGRQESSSSEFANLTLVYSIFKFTPPSTALEMAPELIIL